MIIAIGSEPETLDPTQGWGHGNAPIVQSTLVKYTADLSFENDLAASYSLSEDGLTWTFTLRDDACFTDGKKVTASDVAFTLETAKDAQGAVDLTYMEKGGGRGRGDRKNHADAAHLHFPQHPGVHRHCPRPTPMGRTTAEIPWAPAPTNL